MENKLEKAKNDTNLYKNRLEILTKKTSDRVALIAELRRKSLSKTTLNNALKKEVKENWKKYLEAEEKIKGYQKLVDKKNKEIIRLQSVLWGR